MDKKWREQYNRMLRWYSRLEMEYCRFKEEGESTEIEDLYLCFFQNCYHLSDWLKYSGVIDESGLKKEIERGRSDFQEARKMCRDLCNGSKHLMIVHPSIDGNINLGRISIKQPDSPLKFLHLVEVKGRGQYLAIDIATKCVAFWAEILVSRGLLTKEDAHFGMPLAVSQAMGQ